MFKTIKKYLIITLSVPAILLLSACNSGGGSDNDSVDLEWRENVYRPLETFAGFCNSPAELFFIRSLFNEFYFWYEDIVDTSPYNYIENNFLLLGDYFDYLVTDDTVRPGKLKDEFSFLADATLLTQSSTQGKEVGYGMRLTIDTAPNPDQITVAYVASGSPAANAMPPISRGDTITAAGGFDFSDANRDNAYDKLFPFAANQINAITINGTTPVTLTSALVDMPATANNKVITQNGIDIGYLQFNDHNDPAEQELIDIFTNFQTAGSEGAPGIEELILDLRYNSGGFLYIANQISYMIASDPTNQNKVFETLKYNDRFFDEDIFFLSTKREDTSTALPLLDLSRVIIISGKDTCSASEAIINGLRGIDFEVVLIGDTTCGKPYGFRAFPNCGVAYLPVQFQGVNNKSFGGYIDGFKPSNKPGAAFAVSVNGCAVADDFTKALGDNTEARLAAALTFINDGISDGSCPLPATLIASPALSNSSTNSSASSLPENNLHPSVFRHNHGMRIME